MSPFWLSCPDSSWVLSFKWSLLPLSPVHSSSLSFPDPPLLPCPSMGAPFNGHPLLEEDRLFQLGSSECLQLLLRQFLIPCHLTASLLCFSQSWGIRRKAWEKHSTFHRHGTEPREQHTPERRGPQQLCGGKKKSHQWTSIGTEPTDLDHRGHFCHNDGQQLCWLFIQELYFFLLYVFLRR